MTTIKLTNFKILYTGADGGHHYLSSQISFDNQIREIIVLFKNKPDEQKLDIETEITVSGNLIDQGIKQTLMLLDSEII